MDHCLRKVVLPVFLYCVIAVTHASASDSTSLPPAFKQKLATLREQDNLAEWIYSRMEFTDESPATRLTFLMRTQQDAWRSYKTYDERVAWFYLLPQQGYQQLQAGNILASINAYEAALQFYESYPLPGVDLIEYVLKPLGNNYTRLADYTTALFIHRKTLALALKKNDRTTIASVYSNMAICARWQGDLAAADQYSITGLQYVPPETALHGLLLTTRADILTEKGMIDSAGAVAWQATKLLRQFTTDTTAMYWYSSAMQMCGKLAYASHLYDLSYSYLFGAYRTLTKYFPGSRQRELARIYIMQGEAQRYTHPNTFIALNAFQQAIKTLLPGWDANANLPPAEDLLYGENTLADALAGIAQELEQREPEKALSFYMAAFMVEKKLRKQFFYAESKYKELQVTRARTEAAARLTYRLWIGTHNRKFLDQLLLISEISKAQVLMDERSARTSIRDRQQGVDSLYKKATQLQQAIGYYQHELVNTTDKKNITTLLQSAEYELSLLNKHLNKQFGNDDKLLTVPQLRNLFAHIPPRVTVLEFFAGGDTSFILELRHTGIKAVHCIALGAAWHNQVQQFMRQWFASGPSAMTNNPKQFYKENYAIYTALFSQVQWDTAHHYLLMPDGMFNYLPFDALVTDSAYRNNYRDWPYLFKQVTLSQAYSLQTWYGQQSGAYQQGPFTAYFISKGKGTQQAVLSVEDEYKALHKNISGQYYVNTSATWASFNTMSDMAGVLHISTHAVSSAVDSFPYLQLYDKPFYLFDLRYKHFSPALVVLGACKTADGLLLEGEGVNSISRGFTAAGAGGVVSGLWNVNDKTAVELLQLFYDQLQQHDAATALHKAKLQWLQRNHENAMLQLPYYWAGFVYSGHLQPVKVTAATSYKRYYWWILLLALPLIIYIVVKKNGVINSLY
jgi:CHAT domain-containing protein